jgi:hypothetical protein
MQVSLGKVCVVLFVDSISLFEHLSYLFSICLVAFHMYLNCIKVQTVQFCISQCFSVLLVVFNEQHVEIENGFFTCVVSYLF